MKVKTGLAIPMMAIMSAQAREPKRTIEEKVTVYFENDAGVPAELVSRARGRAAEMFADVGVRIDWRWGQPADSQLLREGAITVRLTLDTPEEFKPSVGAFAGPYEGVHITVLYKHLVWSLAKPGWPRHYWLTC